MLHGKEESINCEKAAKEVFSENSTGINLPSIQLKKNNLKNPINILDLVILSKLEKSKSEIRRLIKGSAVKINNEIVPNDKMNIDQKYFKENFLKLSLGKKRHIKIELV
jgi:tyrosyl-tRNA synthetase